MSILDYPVVEILWVTIAFIAGAMVGSFLNVVVARLPLEKSVLWPGSRCGTCYRKIRFFWDNVPIISYWVLWGKCRSCGSRFSSRYFWVELLTGCAFGGLFYLDVFKNWQHHPALELSSREIMFGALPLAGLFFFAFHATLLSFLIAASLCDLDRRTIPLPLTVTGTLLGLGLSTLFPWPWPNQVSDIHPLPFEQAWFLFENIGKITRGVCPWPVWGPLPSWLPAGSPQLGFATGLVGAAVGTFMIRAIKWIFETGLGKEAIGLGDADFMMMVGAFTGWQVVVVAFFLGSVFALLGVILQTVVDLFRYTDPSVPRPERPIAFVPGLAVGSLVTLLAWPSIGTQLQPFFFDSVLLFIAATIMGGGMFVSSLALRRKTT